MVGEERDSLIVQVLAIKEPGKAILQDSILVDLVRLEISSTEESSEIFQVDRLPRVKHKALWCHSLVPLDALVPSICSQQLTGLQEGWLRSLDGKLLASRRCPKDVIAPHVIDDAFEFGPICLTMRSHILLHHLYNVWRSTIFAIKVLYDRKYLYSHRFVW